MVGIYKITNLQNNKVYIGQSINIQERWKQHKSELNCHRHQNDHLQKAWDIYGKDNFKFEIICECSKDELDDKEIFYISEYNSINRDYGYNIQNGGASSPSAQETIEKLRGCGSDLSKDDVYRIKICMYLLMDRKEISNKYNVSPKVLTAISQGKNFDYILPELNESIHNLKQNLIDERNQKIVLLYDNGNSITEICKIMDLSESIVEKAIYKYRQPKSKESQMKKYNKIFELHNQGINNYQISKLVHVSPSTVKRYLSGEQHPMNKPGNLKVTDDVKDKILQLYFKDSLGSVEISKQLDMSKTTVMSVINQYKNKISA